MIDPNKQIDEAILKMFQQGKTYGEIQTILKVGTHRIYDVIHGNEINHKKGRKPKITQEVLDYIDMQTMANSNISNFNMMKMVKEKFNLDITQKSIANCRKKLGFAYRPPMKVQKLSDEQKCQRMQFATYAKTELINAPIVFSDESRFGIFPDNSWRYIKKGKWNETALAGNEKFIDTVMFWGAIGPGYKSDLVLCSNGVDGNEYISIITKSHMIETCDVKFGKYKWFFMQDGAPSHTSLIASNFFYSKAKVIPGWPPNSPDINPIEMIWSIIKKN